MNLVSPVVFPFFSFPTVPIQQIAAINSIADNVRFSGVCPLGNAPWVFASDLDDTMFRAFQAQLPEDKEAAAVLRRMLGSIPVAYLTGRGNLELTLKIVEEHDLPYPVMVATAVGTRLFINGGDGKFSLLGQWNEFLDGLWSNTVVDEIEPMITSLPGGHPLPGLPPYPHKRTYHAKPFAPAFDVRRQLSAKISGMSDTMDILVSGPNDKDDLLIDVVPKNGKCLALIFFARLFGVHLERTFYAGDSGNDLEPLLSVGFPTLVADGEFGLAEKLAELGVRIYFSPHAHIHGVIDGIKHYKLETRRSS